MADCWTWKCRLLSVISGFLFQTVLVGLWGFRLLILGDFLERQKWLKMITMLCMSIYDIQSPYSELNFNEICVNESETYGFHPPWLPLLFKKTKNKNPGTWHLCFPGCERFEWNKLRQIRVIEAFPFLIATLSLMYHPSQWSGVVSFC